MLIGMNEMQPIAPAEAPSSNVALIPPTLYTDAG
ncbi:hypothetical protein WSK_2344 [Novosphingobium sp. Rr 2-17]|nr:hypothetical protein WSK_2344 [Novosphingobium sp. Rr 2-17]